MFRTETLPPSSAQQAILDKLDEAIALVGVGVSALVFGLALLVFLAAFRTVRAM